MSCSVPSVHGYQCCGLCVVGHSPCSALARQVRGEKQSCDCDVGAFRPRGWVADAQSSLAADIALRPFALSLPYMFLEGVGLTKGTLPCAHPGIRNETREYCVASSNRCGANAGRLIGQGGVEMCVSRLAGHGLRHPILPGHAPLPLHGVKDGLREASQRVGRILTNSSACRVLGFRQSTIAREQDRVYPCAPCI